MAQDRGGVAQGRGSVAQGRGCVTQGEWVDSTHIVHTALCSAIAAYTYTVQACLLHFTRHWHSKYPNECVVNVCTVSDTVFMKLALAMLLVSCTIIRTIANV